MNKKKIVNDPVYGFITIPYEIIYDLIEHPYFQRLRRIQQLGSEIERLKQKIKAKFKLSDEELPYYYYEDETTNNAYSLRSEYDTTSGFRIEDKPLKKPLVSNLIVYPNPASDAFIITYTNASDATWFTIYNILGEQVDRIQLAKGDGKKVYNAADLANGLYFYKVEGLADGTKKEGKIVITKSW